MSREYQGFGQERETRESVGAYPPEAGAIFTPERIADVRRDTGPGPVRRHVGETTVTTEFDDIFTILDRLHGMVEEVGISLLGSGNSIGSSLDRLSPTPEALKAALSSEDTPDEPYGTIPMLRHRLHVLEAAVANLPTERFQLFAARLSAIV